jgi:hypothetical protein
VSPIREQIVREALSVAELRAAVTETEPALRELLGPPPSGSPWDLTHPYRYIRLPSGFRTQGVSTCGLVAAGLLGRVLQLPWADAHYWRFPPPYQGKDIVSCLSRLGIEHPVRLARGVPPQPGDVVCIGSGLATHVLTVIDYDGRTVTSVDGGQVDDAQHRYLQRVKVCRRAWSSMRVVWVLDLDRLDGVLGRVPWGSPAWERTTAGVQWGLRQLGRDPGPIDGVMGPRTRAAVMAFQRAAGLVVDGVVGPATRGALAVALTVRVAGRGGVGGG